MKTIYITLISLLSFCILSAQSDELMGYGDLGILFSEDENNGTARFRAMGGSMAALGGDLSAMAINPAGAAIFAKTQFALSIDTRFQNIKSDYYGTDTETTDNYTTLSQLGTVFVFDTDNYSKWNKVAMGFNYSRSKDFNDFWVAQGNSGFATFIYDEVGNEFLNTDRQQFQNFTSGNNNKFSFTFAGEYDEKIAIGGAINSHSLNFYQRIRLDENNYNDDGQTLDPSLSHLKGQMQHFGYGISFGLGIIVKPTRSIRIGAAYQSPTWYNITEEFYNNGSLNGFEYSLNTPGTATGSFGLVIGDFFLINADYSYRNYKNIKLGPSIDFNNENADIDNQLQGVSQIRLGSELRVGFFSLRGGGFYSENPYKNAELEDGRYGLSAGAGLKLGFMRLDMALEKALHKNAYDFYPQYNEVNATNLDYNTTKMTFTAIFNL